MLLKNLQNPKNKKSIIGRITEISISSSKKDIISRKIFVAETIVMALIVLLIAGPVQALSNSGGGNWQYYRDITINNVGGPLVDYQILVNLTADKFPDNSNNSGGDIRFTDSNGSELSYWIESWNSSRKSANVWVNVTSIPTNENIKIRMYYGNPSAESLSNGDMTFEFFDDFIGSNLDSNKWNKYINYYSEEISNSILTIQGTKNGLVEWYQIASKNSVPINRIIEAKIWTDGSFAHRGLLPAVVYANNVNLRYDTDDVNSGEYKKGIYISYDRDGGLYWSFGVRDADNSLFLTKQDILSTQLDGKWALNSIYYTDNFQKIQMVRVEDSYTWGKSYSNGLSFKKAYIYLGRMDNTGGKFDNTGSPTNRITKFDNIRVRKYASPEPSVSVGTEIEVFRDFKFVQLTDLHIGYNFLTLNLVGRENEMRSSVSSFTDRLQTIKGINSSLILITGDLVEYDEKDFFIAFKNLLRNIGIPIYATPGNHDRRDLIPRGDRLLGDDPSDYNNYVNVPINKHTNPSENNYSFYFKGYSFIGLDSGADFDANYNADFKLFLDNCKLIDIILNPDRNSDCRRYLANASYDVPPESNGLSDIQMANLTHEFNSSAPKVVFMHNPIMSAVNDDILPPDGAPGGNDGTIAFNRWNFINYTKVSNVQLVLTGHSHSDAIFDITTQTVANSSSHRPLFIQTQNKGYRIIEVKNRNAIPYNTESAPRFIRTIGSVYVNYWDRYYRFGLHAYDSQGRHTGMKADCSDFELGIPDSYYTGDYGGNSFTPQIIVGYTNDTYIKSIKKFRIFAPRCLKASIFNAAIFSQRLENASFNMTIEDQAETYTIEVNFYNVNITANSIATVNVSDAMTGYKMDMDINGDGVTDQIINPDSIYITPANPQSNITLLLYNGAGMINLTTSSGNFSRAASLNDSSLPGKPHVEFPYGLSSFNISGLNKGQIVNVTITLPQNIPANSRYWKYGWVLDNTSSYWYQIPIISNDGDNHMQIQLQDGGIGDDDLTANGIILSTGGPGISLPDTNTMDFATGGGWFYTNSENTLEGAKANFGFEVRYRDGKPTGNLEFKNKESVINMKSETIDWLDVSDGSVRFQGIGTINGEGLYNFLVLAKDNGETGPGKDYFDISIWDYSNARSGFHLKARKTLSGGNIKVHQK